MLVTPAETIFVKAKQLFPAYGCTVPPQVWTQSVWILIVQIQTKHHRTENDKCYKHTHKSCNFQDMFQSSSSVPATSTSRLSLHMWLRSNVRLKSENAVCVQTSGHGTINCCLFIESPSNRTKSSCSCCTYKVCLDLATLASCADDAETLHEIGDAALSDDVSEHLCYAMEDMISEDMTLAERLALKSINVCEDKTKLQYPILYLHGITMLVRTTRKIQKVMASSELHFCSLSHVAPCKYRTV